MVDQELSKHVLTIGPVYDPPMGGIAQTVYNYKNMVFEQMDIICCNYFGIIKNLYYFVSSVVILLMKMCFCHRIKIVHIHSAAYRSFARASVHVIIAKAFRRKVVMHLHSGYFKQYYEQGNQRFILRILNKCDSIIVLSEQWRQFYTQELKLNNVTIIPNVIPVPESHPVASDGKVHMLFLGHVKQQKGVFDIAEALGKMQTSIRNLMMMHIGGMGEMEALEKAIKDNHVEDCVVVEGWISGEQKVKLLNKCEVFVLPSYFEGLPLSILESMSYSMAIISTKIGGIPSIVSQGNGLLIEPGDVSGLASAMETLVTNQPLRQSMGMQSTELCQAFYPESIANELSNLYRSLL
ncbi:MAG: glycosyltransferase family 4 protein [Muribaculaceae bacterium]|nr:glycosyltransferase family 4 protein [Muribaculaceae bacterium]